MFDIFEMGENPINVKFNNEEVSLLESMHIPSTYYKNKNEAYRYWFRSLLQRLYSSIEFSNLPNGWSKDFLYFCLFCSGKVAVFKSSRSDLENFGEGVLFNPCHLSGINFYFEPTYAQIANPYYEANLKIGSECEILKLTPDYRSVLDIIDFFASKLAEISKSIDMGLINAKVPMILSASTEAQNQKLRKIYDKVQAGESLVIYYDEKNDDEIIPSKEPFEFWNQDYKQTYIVHDLLDDWARLIDDFCMEIGIPTGPSNDKKERLITSEADFSEKQAQSRIQCWKETVEESLDRINKLFGTDIQIKIYAEAFSTEKTSTVNSRRINL